MRKLIKRLFSDESGATLVEYGLLIALIAAIAVGVIAVIGGQVQDGFQQVSDAMTSAGITGS